MAETKNNSSHVMKIPTTKEKFFLEYLMIKRPVLNSIIRKINNGQQIRGKTPELHYMPMKVLAQLLYYNDKYRSYPDEDRFITIGMDSFNRILVIVYTWRESRIRIISARKADKDEQKTYWEFIK